MLKIKDMNLNNVIRQGDSQPREYQLDTGNLNLNLANKQATIRLMTGDYRGIAYETTATVSSENIISFSIDDVIPAREYRLEITVDDYVFPSRATDGRFDIDPSSHGQEVNIIQIIGKDEIVREVKEQIEPFLGDIEQAELDRQAQEEARETAEGERQEEYQKYGQQFTDVITELSEEKDYHSLPEIVGARGGFDTLGDRLNETTAQLAQTLSKNITPIFLADMGVSHLNTATENTTIIKQAILEAEAESRPIILPWVPEGSFIDIDDKLDITTGNIKIYGFGKQSRIRQTVFPKQIFHVLAPNVEIESLFLSGVDFNAAGTADSHVTYSGVYIEADNVKVNDIYGDSLSTVVNVAAPTRDKPLEGVSVTNVESTNRVVFNLLFSGTKGLCFDNIHGSYSFMGAPTPPHLIYASQGFGDNYDINGGRAHAIGGTGSYAFQFKGMRGGSIDLLKSDESRGSLHIMESSDFKVGEVISNNDTRDDVTDGSFAISGTNDRIIVDKVTIKMSGNGKPFNIGGLTSNSKVKNLEVEANHDTQNVAENAMDVEIRGTNNVVENIESRNVGSARWSASIGIFTGKGNRIVAPKTSGNFDGVYIRDSASGEGGHSMQDYREEDFTDYSRRAYSIQSAAKLERRDTKEERLIAYDRGNVMSGSDVAPVVKHTTSGHEWVVPFGEFRNTGTRIYSSIGIGSMAYLSLSSPNIELSFGLKYANREACVIRAIDYRNYIGARIDHALNLAYIYKSVSNVITRIAEVPFTVKVGRRYEFKIIAYDDTIDFFVDNAKTVSAVLDTDTMTMFTSSNHGILGLEEVNGFYDNILWKSVE